MRGRKTEETKRTSVLPAPYWRPALWSQGPEALTCSQPVFQAPTPRGLSRSIHTVVKGRGPGLPPPPYSALSEDWGRLPGCEASGRRAGFSSHLLCNLVSRGSKADVAPGSPLQARVRFVEHHQVSLGTGGLCPLCAVPPSLPATGLPHLCPRAKAHTRSPLSTHGRVCSLSIFYASNPLTARKAFGMI